MMKTNPILLVVLLLLSFTCSATTYTLEDCRKMAVEGGMNVKMQDEARQAAALNRQAAMAAMFPKVTLNMGYTWNSADVHLLANQTDFAFGTAGVGADGSPWFEWSEDADLLKLVQQSGGVGSGSAVTSAENVAGQVIADTYQQLYEALSLDVHHVLVGQAGITQPIYVGGRLRELYKLAQAAERMVDMEADSKREDLIVSVDEAYWRVISVENKYELALNYYQLLVKLEGDVEQLVEAGMCTQSDLLNVKAKRGEAEVKKLQAENGLRLSKMALCQVCGLPLDSEIELDDSGLPNLILTPNDLDVDAAVEQRTELRLLQETEQISKSKVRLVSAGLQPNIVASANYIYTNPYATNGLQSDFRNKGFFSAGVVVNIPVAHAEDILRLKAAKHEAVLAGYKTEEVREMLALQTTQAYQKLLEANQKVQLAELNVRNSEEVLRLADESFRSGMATTGDLMQAQTAWHKAASDLVDARIEAHVCNTYLSKYTGQLPDYK